MTVSRVINDYPHVTPAVRERVRQAIAQLRYRPNTMAQALATNRSMRIGVVTFALSVTSPSRALFGVSEEARAYGYATDLVTLDDVTVSSLQTALRHLATDAVDGAVLLAPMVAAPRTLQVAQAPMPVVSFEQGATGAADAVALDEEFAAQLATRHLLDLGHETVHFIRGPDGWMATEARETGWRRELALAGRHPPEPAHCPDWGVESGYRASKKLLERGDVTAILVSNDAMCLGVYTAVFEAGLTVPDDVSVVGFDNVPEAAYYRPPLTTVELDFTAAGRAALRRLLRLIGVDAPGPVDAPTPSLVVRASTAPPRR